MTVRYRNKNYPSLYLTAFSRRIHKRAHVRRSLHSCDFEYEFETCSSVNNMNRQTRSSWQVNSKHSLPLPLDSVPYSVSTSTQNYVVSGRVRKNRPPVLCQHPADVHTYHKKYNGSRLLLLRSSTEHLRNTLPRIESHRDLRVHFRRGPPRQDLETRGRRQVAVVVGCCRGCAWRFTHFRRDFHLHLIATNMSAKSQAKFFERATYMPCLSLMKAAS